MTLDSHQHFWRYNPQEYPWIPPGSPLFGDRLPADLAPFLKAAGISGCVAVQARQSIEESRWLLGLANESPIIQAVVGWVDLRSKDVDGQLKEFSRFPRFRGVRHVVQDEPDDFMLGAEFQRGIARLAAHGLTYDILIYARHLPAAIALVNKFPSQPFVLDHIGKPQIKAGEFKDWNRDIRELARSPNILCKVSGMVTEADWKDWRKEDFTPYLDTVFAAFGTKRLMYGSDWPVSTFAASYEKQFELIANYTAKLTAAERAAVLGDNAAQFYGIEK